MISAERLRELLNYDHLSGTFSWRINRPRAKPGQAAGWIDPDGYVHIRVDGRLYPRHRLAWLYMTGSWPPSGYIDHKNSTPGDDRWQNLRDATKRINQENRRRASRNNKSGLLGVSPNGKRWAATITAEGKHRYLGTFDTPAQAHSAYLSAKRNLHHGCTI